MARPVCSDRNAASVSAQRCPVPAAGLRRRSAGQRVDEMVELQPVRLDVPFEEEGQRLAADDPVRSGNSDRAQGGEGAMIGDRLDEALLNTR